MTTVDLEVLNVTARHKLKSAQHRPPSSPRAGPESTLLTSRFPESSDEDARGIRIACAVRVCIGLAFGAGFVPGSVRMSFLVSHLGERVAEKTEMRRR